MSLADEQKIKERIDFINSLMKGYQQHKESDLFQRIKQAKNLPDFEKKVVRNSKIDPFKNELKTTITVNHQWNADIGYYQAYYPIKQNVHLNQPMDWMQLARPGGFPKVPAPMKFNHQDKYYPRDYDDEKHTKLTLLVNFGFEQYGFDPIYIHILCQLLEIPEKRVINYICKTFKNNRESTCLKKLTDSKKAKKLAEERLEKYKNIIGPEVAKFVTTEDLLQIGEREANNRSFLYTQYFCLHCEVFFCSDHINCDYDENFYFQYDDTEYSEFKSDLFLSKKKSSAELEKMMKNEAHQNTVQSYVECSADKTTCWKSISNLDTDSVLKKIAMRGEKLERIKNFLRVCINSGTNNPCFLEYVIPGLKCNEVGSLISKIYKDEFKNSSESFVSRSLGNKKSGQDRKKVISPKLDMDKSQFTSFFGEDFTFPKHYHNLLLQKNRIIIGHSGICPGLGLFAGQKFKKDQLVCIYFGEILAEEDTSGLRAKINTLYGTSYVFSLSDGKQFSIDSLIYGNKSRFVNHNELSFNNCMIELAEINKMEYIVFKAKKDIEFGEELFFDYGESYTLHWKFIYKHLANWMSKISEKKKNSAKITASMKNRFKTTMQ
jgi:hypothetical protein